LNPDELVWNQMRHPGTTRKPLKKDESLKKRAANDLQSIKDHRALIKSFFREPAESFAAAQVVFNPGCNIGRGKFDSKRSK
jgi:hypothetical protein